MSSIIIIYFKDNDSIIGLTLATKVFINRLHFFRTSAALFYKSGDVLDHITPEYTGILCKENHHIKLIDILCTYTETKKLDWNLTIFESSVVKPTLLEGAYLKEHPTYYVDLSLVKRHYNDYLSLLTRNTRWQIRRSIKEYEKLLGKLTIHFPENKKTCDTRNIKL